nr:MAG TPA: hypothetical protein [Caudoviricetes sp.]
MAYNLSSSRLRIRSQTNSYLSRASHIVYISLCWN